MPRKPNLPATMRAELILQASIGITAPVLHLDFPITFAQALYYVRKYGPKPDTGTSEVISREPSTEMVEVTSGMAVSPMSTSNASPILFDNFDQYHSSKTVDLTQHIYRVRAFSRSTFGPGDRTAGVLDHIRKEIVEVEKAKEARDLTAENGNSYTAANDALLEEWVDLIILSIDGAWRTGASPEMIVRKILAKQLNNEFRHWPDWRVSSPDKAIEHERT